MTAGLVGERMRRSGEELATLEREILEIERHSQLTAMRLLKIEKKLLEARADSGIFEMALNRMIAYYQEQVPDAPKGREELLRFLEEGGEE